METKQPTSITVQRSAYKALGGRCFFSLVHAYLLARAVNGVSKVSNKEASEYFGVTPRYITAAITAIRRAGLVQDYQYDGRHRIVKLTTTK